MFLFCQCQPPPLERHPGSTATPPSGFGSTWPLLCSALSVVKKFNIFGQVCPIKKLQCPQKGSEAPDIQVVNSTTTQDQAWINMMLLVLMLVLITCQWVVWSRAGWCCPDTQTRTRGSCGSSSGAPSCLASSTWDIPITHCLASTSTFSINGCFWGKS